MLSPVINQEDYNPVYDSDTITIGRMAGAGLLVPIKNSTGKVKDTSSDSVAGNLHTVNVTCEVDDRDSNIPSILRKLKNTPAHLELTSMNGERFFVQSSTDTYLCSIERDGAKVSVSLRVQCTMGLQRIVEN